MVGSNADFLRYIRDVLPALGEVDATQSTIAELAARALRRSTRSGRSAATSRPPWPRWRENRRWPRCYAGAWLVHVTMPTEGLVVPRGARRSRVATYEVEELVGSLRARGVRYGGARPMVPQALAHRVLVRMELAGDSPDDRVQSAVAGASRSRTTPPRCGRPSTGPAGVAAASDPAFLAAAADGLLSEEEQALLLWAKPPKSPASTP